MDLKTLQEEHRVWSTKNFDCTDKIHPILGVVEEVGELAHAILKQAQCIRGDYGAHELEAKDAVGDIIIYLVDVCSRRGWDLDDVVTSTWNQVKKRDWEKNKFDGSKVLTMESIAASTNVNNGIKLI
jgi:NTP pyrophosphatase (non-canonical NTP hydrolase)